MFLGCPLQRAHCSERFTDADQRPDKRLDPGLKVNVPTNNPFRKANSPMNSPPPEITNPKNPFLDPELAASPPTAQMSRSPPKALDADMVSETTH